MKGNIPIILISGFLGSGKTTLVNRLIGISPDKKIGIIVNDFGSIGIDAALIERTGGSIVRELNNGQIFCSCLSGSFVKSVSTFADLDIDFLLVETSGLAKPSAMLEIINAIKELNAGVFSYHGMISLVDTENYLEISEVLNAVDEQIAYSDLVVLNKIDLADSETIRKAEAKILSVNPGTALFRTEYGRISSEVFHALGEKREIPGPDSSFAGWGKTGRPVPLVLEAEKSIQRTSLERFINEIHGSYFRLKGTITTESGQVYVDCTPSRKKIHEIAGTCDGLVIILPADREIVAGVKERAARYFFSVK